MMTLAIIRAEIQKFRSENLNRSSSLPPHIKAVVLEACKSHRLSKVGRARD